MKHRFWKRLTAFILSLCLLLGAMPLQALAAVSQTKHNSVAENQAILEKLQALTGSEEEASAALAAMRDMGLVDEDGNLLQTEKVTLNGQEMTLDQVKDYIAGCDDGGLSQTVDIDGTEVSLENLSVMLAIEEQMDLLREFFNDEAPDLTPEQQASLESLANQLQTQGITLQNQAAREGSFTFASGVDHSAQVSMNLAADNAPTTTDGSFAVPNEAGAVTVTFQLNHPVEKDVTFTVRTLDGSAKAGTNYETLDEQTVTISAEDNSASVDIIITPEENEWTNDDLWSGDKVFFIQATDITNALFDGGNHSLLQAVRITEELPEYDYEEENPWFPTGVSATYGNPTLPIQVQFDQNAFSYSDDEGETSSIVSQSTGTLDEDAMKKLVGIPSLQYFIRNSLSHITLSWFYPDMTTALPPDTEYAQQINWFYRPPFALYNPDQVANGNESEVRPRTYSYYGMYAVGVGEFTDPPAYGLHNFMYEKMGLRLGEQPSQLKEVGFDLQDDPLKEGDFKKFFDENFKMPVIDKNSDLPVGLGPLDFTDPVVQEAMPAIATGSSYDACLADSMEYVLSTTPTTLQAERNAVLEEGGLELYRHVGIQSILEYVDNCTNWSKDNVKITDFKDCALNHVKIDVDAMRPSLTLSDKVAPILVEIAPQGVPTNGYKLGETVPITVTFDGPVKVTGKETLLVNKSVDDDGTVKTKGTQCEIVESVGTITRTVTFLYEVQAGDSIGLRINEISSFTDTANNESKQTALGDEGKGIVVDNVVDDTIPHWAAIAGVDTDAEGTDASNKEYLPGTTQGKILITLSGNENVNSWLTSATDRNTRVEYENETYFKSKSLAASLEGGAQDKLIDLYINEAGTKMIGDMTFAVDLKEGHTYAVELFDLTETDPEEGQLQPMFGLYTGFTIPAPVFLDGTDDLEISLPSNWPEAGESYTNDLGEQAGH